MMMMMIMCCQDWVPSGQPQSRGRIVWVEDPDPPGCQTPAVSVVSQPSPTSPTRPSSARSPAWCWRWPRLTDITTISSPYRFSRIEGEERTDHTERSHFRLPGGENLRRKEPNFTSSWITSSWLSISSCKSIFACREHCAHEKNPMIFLVEASAPCVISGSPWDLGSKATCVGTVVSSPTNLAIYRSRLTVNRQRSPH